MASQIPGSAREVVRVRDMNRCTRCLSPVSNQWHHRRSRSVVDEHRHCACNGISLCPACHAWVHAHPFESKQKGWIVSRHSTPNLQAVETQQFGWVTLECDGGYAFAFDPQQEEVP